MNRLLSTPASTLRQIRRTTAAVAAFPTDDSNPYQILWHYQILDPSSDIATHWNHVFLLTCLVALFIDPLYFYIPRIGGPACLERETRPAVLITIFRSMADLFYLLHMILKFRTGFVAPSSKVFGRGELVMDPREIAIRYLKNDFVIDLAATLPLPQIVTWLVIPATRDSRVDHTNSTLALIVIFQYIPRMFLIFPLNQRIIKSTGVVARTAWAGAVYNLLLYMLASHLTGAAWYLIAVGRQFHCWDMECKTENSLQVISCLPNYLDCASKDQLERKYWLNVTMVTTNCDPKNKESKFKFGMYADGVTRGVAEQSFFNKLLYCLWWGLRNLSSYGQNLETSTYYGETTFCILINVIGLLLFAQLIGKMENYLQSLTLRIEEWRIKKRDTEEWMRHRQLPPDLQERVRRYVQYKWLATRGVDEESILQDLPVDLRRQIQRHLCLSLVRRVPFFSQVDDQLLDAICERLSSSLCTSGTYIFQEGDPVNEMLFIIRGQLESSTTNGGRSGFFNSITLRPGDFCGEELLTWALMQTSSANMPLSTRTVKALCEVEAFALPAEDLKIVSNQFKRLHSKKLQHAFRYYSQQWRTWGACFLQAAWRRYKRRKMSKELAAQESLYYKQIYGQESYNSEDADAYYEDPTGESSDAYYENPTGESSIGDDGNRNVGETVLASKRKGTQQKTIFGGIAKSSLKMPELKKPDEPDFDVEEEDSTLDPDDD